MSHLDGVIASSSLAIGLGDTAAFRAKDSGTDITCTVLVDRNVSLQGDQSQVINDAITITAYVADLGANVPKYGDKFTVGTETFKVDSCSPKGESAFVCVVTEFCQ